MKNQKFTLTKRVAKMGRHSIIIIPKILEDKIKPSDLVQVEISLLGNNEDIENGK